MGSPPPPKAAVRRFWAYVMRIGAMPAQRTPLKDQLLVTGLCTFSIIILASLAGYALTFVVLLARAP